MWAYRTTGPNRLERVEVPEPDHESIPPQHVLLRTIAGGICGSDIPKFTGSGALGDRDSPSGPGPLGSPLHEIVGEVVASRCDDHRIGVAVVGWASRSDALAEYVVTDGRRVAPYDPSLEPRRAVLIQSIACVLHAMDRVAVAGRHVAVLGLGPIGLLFAHAARHRGASRVTGVDPVDRTQVAERLGIDDLVTAGSGAWQTTLDDDNAPTVCVEAVGHQSQTLHHALHATAAKGTILCFGIPDVSIYPVDIERLMRGHLTLIGGTTFEHRRALDAAAGYLARYPDLYDALVTHSYPHTEVQAAFDLASVPSPERIKVLLDLRS